MPAFSATLTDDPDGLGEAKTEKPEEDDATSWYDLGGRPAPPHAKDGIYVAKGKTRLR